LGLLALRLNTITITDNVDAGGAFVDGIRYDYSFGGPASQGGRQALYTSILATYGGYECFEREPELCQRHLQRKCHDRSDGGTNLTTDARGAFFGLNPIGIAFQRCYQPC
jgi:hypothetical protein